jgi:DtxR family Mn-dependent transcriptional regulator
MGGIQMARGSVQQYLDVIKHLQEESEAEVSISAVATRLGVSQPSVSEMVKKLTEMGLVHHVPYGKISLTEEGEYRMRSLSRRHRLWQTFLLEHLGLDEHQANEAACELEHATSTLVETKLAEFLGHPDR